MFLQSSVQKFMYIVSVSQSKVFDQDECGWFGCVWDGFRYVLCIYKKRLILLSLLFLICCLVFVQADGVLNQFPDDVDDDDDLREFSKVSFQRTIAEHSIAGRPMNQHTAVVGDLCQCFFRNAGDSFCGSLWFSFVCFLVLFFSRNWKRFYLVPA